MTTRAPGGRRTAVAVFACALLVNLLAWYGGLRSPDEEVMFEVCEALHDRRSFSVVGESRHEGFGLAPGRDQRHYAVFGPGVPLACVPLLTVARLIDRSHWYATTAPPPSFYLDDGYERFVTGEAPRQRDLVLHAERTIVSLLGVLVSALSAVVLWRLATRLARQPLAPLAVTGLFVAGTPAWAYSGTFFSEPLATLLVLSALLALEGGRSRARDLAAGFALGAAVATHVSMLLAVPFVAGWALATPERRKRPGWFLVALGITLAALACYQLVLFGSPFETGRGVDPVLAERFGYGHKVAPWRGLYGLLVSPGKGIFWYAPAIVLGLWAWPALHRLRPRMSWMLAALVLTRLFFLATRSDWHGGFCLGPRLLLPVVPFLLLPIVPWLDERQVAGDRRALRGFTAAAMACIAQQAMFAIGEPFSFYQRIRMAALLERVDVFAGDRIYLEWRFAPLLHLLDGLRAPWLLRGLPLSNLALWAVVSIAVAGAYALLVRRRSPLLPRSPGD